MHRHQVTNATTGAKVGKSHKTRTRANAARDRADLHHGCACHYVKYAPAGKH